MTQAALFIGLHLLGLIVCLAVGPWRRPALCAALGFSTGLAVLCLLGLVALMLGVPYGGVTVLAIALLIAGGGIAIIARRGTDKRTLKIAGLWTLAFAACAVVFAFVNLAIMTHDSFIFVMLGRAIGDDGALHVATITQLDEWGVFQVIAHSLASFADVSFLYGLPPVLGFTLAPVFGLVFWHASPGGTRRMRIAVIALVLAAGFGNYMAIFHLFYLHTNMGSAVYLFGFVALFWLAETEQDTSLLPIAFLSLGAFALQRTETPLVALIFLALTIPVTTLPKRAITAGLVLFIAIVGGWYEFLAHYVADEGDFLTPTRCRMVWGAMVLVLAWWLASGHRIIAAINRVVPLLVAGVFALAVVAAFAVRTDHMTESIQNWGSNLFRGDYWGQMWFGAVALAGLGLALPRPRFRQAFVIGVPVYLAFVLLLALARSPYRGYVDDSANRMTIHIVPVMFFYFALKLGAATDLVRRG